MKRLIDNAQEVMNKSLPHSSKVDDSTQGETRVINSEHLNKSNIQKRLIVQSNTYTKKLSKLQKTILKILYEHPKTSSNSSYGYNIRELTWNVAFDYNTIVLFYDTRNIIISLEDREKGKGLEWFDKLIHDRHERYRLGYIDNRFHASMSRSLKRLEKRGLIKRLKNEWVTVSKIMCMLDDWYCRKRRCVNRFRAVRIKLTEKAFLLKEVILE